MNTIQNKTLYAGILNKSIINPKIWKKTHLCKIFNLKLRFLLSGKNRIQLHLTTVSMQIINAINANSYLSIYYYCHGFGTCLSQHKLGLRQKEVFPQASSSFPATVSHMGSTQGTEGKSAHLLGRAKGQWRQTGPHSPKTQENARCVWEQEDGSGTRLSKPQQH